MEKISIPWSISEQERLIAQACIDKALEAGASQIRVSMNKSMMDLYTILNGELDKVTHSGDRSLSFNIFADGKYGAFSTNKIDKDSLDKFIVEAVATVRTLAKDACRKLPDSSRTAKDATSGMEAGLYDGEYANMDSSRRLSIALGAAAYGKIMPEDCKLVSEEMEYSDSIYDNYVIDSNGLGCRHIETSFEIGCETTVEDENGQKFSGYWWESSAFFSKLKIEGCCAKAYSRARAQIGAKAHRCGKFNMVVENEVASKLVNPLLNALGGFSLQQQNSFLRDSLGKKLFPEGLTIMDLPRVAGANGARFFDSEGVATKDSYIIQNGVVREYFINTYISGKMGMDPTIEDSTRATVLPFLNGASSVENLDAAGIMAKMGKGIFVTGFNGGNSNSATGDFSYGIEGFAFSRGKISHPLKGMVITGNFMDLWNSLYAAGTDPRDGMNKAIPSLGFENVDFSA